MNLFWYMHFVFVLFFSCFFFILKPRLNLNSIQTETICHKAYNFTTRTCVRACNNSSYLYIVTFQQFFFFKKKLVLTWLIGLLLLLNKINRTFLIKWCLNFIPFTLKIMDIQNLVKVWLYGNGNGINGVIIASIWRKKTISCMCVNLWTFNTISILMDIMDFQTTKF